MSACRLVTSDLIRSNVTAITVSGLFSSAKNRENLQINHVRNWRKASVKNKLEIMLDYRLTKEFFNLAPK
jgi:hypothetical protein